VIRLEHVNVTYRLKREGVEALRDVNLTVNEGAFHAITGPSGSGKTTLIQLIAGLLTPTSGRVEVAGHALHEFDDTEMSRFRNQTIGFIFQFFNLPGYYTALENVALPLVFAGVEEQERHRRAAVLLEEFGLADRARHKPDQLSGGEEQRVAIARALVSEPKIILADEPTGNLDLENGARVMDLLKEVSRSRGVTVLVVTHDEKVTKFADAVIRIEKGELVP